LTIDQREQHISEFLSLKIIEKLLPTGAISQCEYAELAGLSCIISSRYDREINGNSIKRIHQEDFCQILGIDPEIKYEMHGGPNATRIIDVINKYSHAPEADTKLFASCLFLNYLMMCPDGHGKNYSMLIKEEYFRLAPIYDFTSIAYLDTSKIKDGLKETAMGIDGKRKYNTISGDNILRFFHKNNLPLEEYIPMIMEYCTKLPEIIEQTMAEYSNLGISDSFRSNFTSNIGKSSRHLLEQIQKISPKQK
jgi:serine/threonine-protein kinase HipA